MAGQKNLRVDYAWRRRKISFYAELPAIGAATFRIKPVEEKKQVQEAVPSVKFTLSPETGFIEELFWGSQQCLTGSLLRPVIL